jgi:hypothetical protein
MAVIGSIVDGVLVALGVMAAIALVLWGSAMARLNAVQDAFDVARTAIDDGTELPDGSAGPVVDVLDAALQDGTVSTEGLSLTALNHWARQLGGLFVFVGLVGTVAGMAWGLAALGDTLQTTGQAGSAAATGQRLRTTLRDKTDPAKQPQNLDKEIEDMRSAIVELLASMRGSASCTLWGLIATVAFAFLNGVFAQRAMALEDSIAAYAARECLPRYREQVESRTNTGQQELLTAAVQQQADAIGQLTAASAAALSTSEQLAQQAAGIGGGIQSAASDLADNCLVLIEAQRTVLGLLTRAQALVADNAPAIAEALHHLGTASTGLSDEKATLDDVAASVRQAAVTVSGESRLVREALVDGQRHTASSIEAVLAGAAQQQQRLERLLSSFELALADASGLSVASTVRQAVDELRRAIAAEGNELTRLSTVVAELAKPDPIAPASGRRTGRDNVARQSSTPEATSRPPIASPAPIEWAQEPAPAPQGTAAPGTTNTTGTEHSPASPSGGAPGGTVGGAQSEPQSRPTPRETKPTVIVSGSDAKKQGLFARIFGRRQR